MITEKHFDNADRAAVWLAEQVAGRLQSAIDARGAASLVVPGGRSPVAMFQALSRQPLDWSRVGVTLTDERWVETSSPDSNENLIRTHLLTGEAAKARFVPLKTSATLASDALAERGDALEAMPHPFDVVVLGMGEDGHFASLFPDALGLEAALDPKGTALLADIDPPAAPYERLSLTLAALLDSRWIVLPILGETKRCVYAESVNGVSPLVRPIAALLQQNRVPLQVCLIDP